MKRDKEWFINELYEKEIDESNDYYNDGFTEGLGYAIYLAEKIDEPEKVIIPQFVADAIESHKLSKDLLVSAFENGNLDDWLYGNMARNMDVLARAWLDGYEVEKEKLYQVIFPTKDTEWKYYYLDCDGGIRMTNHLENVNCHTEYFIRSISDELWAFAVEVPG